MNSPVMQGLNLNAPAFVKNAKLIAWVAKMAALCKPADIQWCDGSTEEYDRLCAEMVASGTFTRLNQDLWPGCFRRAVVWAVACTRCSIRLRLRPGSFRCDRTRPGAAYPGSGGP